MFALLAGCAAPEKPAGPDPPRQYLVLIPGVEGGAWQLAAVKDGLHQAGYEGKIEILEWGIRPFGSLINLTNLPENRKRADKFAARIRSIKNQYPRCDVTLVGYSGGGGLAALTAERLDAQSKLDRLILIAAALSPRYDLTPAMNNSNHGIINFYSPCDSGTLGFGTSVFGTIDRVYTNSAGFVGFQDADGHLLQKPGLTQISWEKSWARLGHWGGHVGWLMAPWTREILAPQLKPAA
ncbi:MAG TPA: hypothetical protein VMV81_01385 [Phycisphaerae bacterium]|nr:hypothetical protein [Phycisphaerae bacterium]